MSTPTPPYHLFVKVLHDTADDRSATPIEDYGSLTEAENDARRLYLVHNKHMDAKPVEVDVQVFDAEGNLVYSVDRDPKPDLG